MDWNARRLVALVGSLWLAAASLAAETVRVGVIVDGPWEGNEQIQALTQREILALTEGEFDVEFGGYVAGDWTLATAVENLEAMLADPEVDIVITWGLLSSNAVCCYGELPKPVIAPVVIDPVLQGLPYDNGASGVPNLNYVALPDSLAGELETFRAIVPFRRVAILSMAALVEAIPDLPLRTRANLEGKGLAFDYISVESSADEALAAIPPEADAVYVWPLFHMPRTEFARLVAGLNARRLPSFSALGGPEIGMGMLASAGSDEFFPRLARRIALNLQRILLGEDAGTLPVEFPLRSDLVVNMATARAIDVSPRWEVLVEARLLNEDPVDGVRRLTLPEAVEEAVSANLDLVVRRRALEADEQEVAKRRANLLPRVEASLTDLTIDDDRAAASFGSQPERSLTASAALSQLVYSDAALAGWQIERHLQAQREWELESLRLDIALEAAQTYLNLLRAKTLVEVQRNNVRLTRSNLDIARLRQSIGAANPAEVYRWESRIATDRKALIESIADRRVAEIALNRLLRSRQDEPLVAVEASLEDPRMRVTHTRFVGYIETPKRFATFSEFMVREGLQAAPELKGLRSLIDAQERAVKAARRSYWSPTVALQVALDEVLSKSGAGSAGFSLGLPIALPTVDDSSWSVAVNASLPLFTGGLRSAELVQAELRLEQLRFEFESASEKVEQAIRSRAQIARASYAGIELSQKAAEAAAQNLELVADAYARGALSILELLDAQNAAFGAEQLAANAVHDFLIDLMEVQRATARFELFISLEEHEAWHDRLDQYFADAGIPKLEP